MIVCVVDRSVLCELLAVPGKSQRHAEALAQFEEKQESGHQFVLPIAALVETGNHIAHIKNGRARRDVAERFVQLATNALDRRSPFAPTAMPDLSTVRGWLNRFADDATRGVGIADRSIIAVWEAKRELHARAKYRVYIWSFDDHLSSYDDRGS
jgi:hypothetical protein